LSASDLGSILSQTNWITEKGKVLEELEMALIFWNDLMSISICPLDFEINLNIGQKKEIV